MLDSPFFGRVDFCYDGDDEPEVFYIGIGNFAEEAGKVPLIYDWRAPVSGLFYDYDKGRPFTKHRQESWREKSHPSGSIRSEEENWSMDLKAMSKSMMRF